MKFREKKRDLKLLNPAYGRPVRIVGDGAIASSTRSHGVLIPALILDTKGRKDIEDLISLHAHTPDGDVDSTWGRNLDHKEFTSIRLVLEFKRPVETQVIVDFELPKLTSIVESIVSSELLYLVSGEKGDRLSHLLNNESIIAEIPSSEFRETWDYYSEKSLVKFYRSQGASRSAAKEMAKIYKNEIAKIARTRVG